MAHMVNLCLAFLRNLHTVFHNSGTLFPWAVDEGSNFSHILVNTCFFLLILSHLMCVKYLGTQVFYWLFL